MEVFGSAHADQDDVAGAQRGGVARRDGDPVAGVDAARAWIGRAGAASPSLRAGAPHTRVWPGPWGCNTNSSAARRASYGGWHPGNQDSPRQVGRAGPPSAPCYTRRGRAERPVDPIVGRQADGRR
jgi:hypothetical protein